MNEGVKLSMAIAAMLAWDEQLSHDDGSFGLAEVRQAIRATLAAIAAPRRASEVIDSLEELLDAPPVDSAAYVLLLEEYVTARLREVDCAGTCARCGGDGVCQDCGKRVS